MLPIANPTNPDSLAGKIILGLVRHTLNGILAGYVAKGLLTNDQETTALSAIMLLVPIGLSVYDKIQSHQTKGA